MKALSLSFLICSLLIAPGAPASHQIPSQSEILALIKTIEQDAETQVIAVQGQWGFQLLKQRFNSRYPPGQFGAPASLDDCPGLRYPEAFGQGAVHAEVVDRGGAYLVLGIEAVVKGAPDIAKWGFAKAAELAPMCSVHLSNLAFILNLENDFRSAAELLKFAYLLDPANSSIHVNLGYSYTKMKRYDDAIESYLIAVALDPEIIKYHELLQEVEKLKKEDETRPLGVIARRKGRVPPVKPDLDSALGLLEEKKEADFEEELSEDFMPAPPGFAQGGGRKQMGSRKKHKSASRLFRSYGAGGYGSDCGILMPYVPLLRKASDMYRGRSDELKHEQRISGEMRALGSKGMYYISTLFDGYAADILEGCGFSEEADAIWAGHRENFEEFLDEHFKKMQSPKGKKDSKKKKKYGRPLCFGPTCLSTGEGRIKLDVSLGLIGVDLKLGKKMSDWGFKIGIGPQIKGGIGPLAVAAGVEAYIEFSGEKGFVKAGVQAKAGADSAFKDKGGEGTIGSKTSVSRDIIKTTFENHTVTN